MLLVGKYIPPELNGGTELIVRDWYRQGWIFKDEDAWRNRPEDVCYIPEGSDTKYTRNDIFKLCTENEEIAEDVFDLLDWQHVESELEDLEVNEEIVTCEKCGKMYTPYEELGEKELKNRTECPYCHAKYKADLPVCF